MTYVFKIVPQIDLIISTTVVEWQIKGYLYLEVQYLDNWCVCTIYSIIHYSNYD